MPPHDVDLLDPRDELPHRLLQRAGAIPRNGLGIGRRAVIYALVAWLPIMIWAVVTGRLAPTADGETVLQHFGIHARCLVAIPLMVLGATTARAAGARAIQIFLERGMVPADQLGHFEKIVASHVRLRRTAIPWAVIAAFVVAAAIAGPQLVDKHDISFAGVVGTPNPSGAEPGVTFGTLWYVYVSRTVFLALLFTWLWRLVLLTHTLGRIAKLNLSLVATHPDRSLGLGFLEKLPGGNWPFVLGISTLLASQWAHHVVYHGLDERKLALPLALFVLVVAVLLLSPLLAFCRPMARAKRQALTDYGTLIARHGRLVHERWIEGRELPDARLLQAAELGPVADTVAIYAAVKASRTVPFGLPAIASIVLAIAIPMFALAALQFPIADLLKGLLKALF